MKNSTRSILPALFVVGGGLASTPSAAIELGEINVQSTLGQPLRASIAYALGPNEQVADYCVRLNPGFAANGLPAITRASVSVANGIIALSGKTALREPLMTLRVDVACQYTPRISREYMLFIDPARPVQEQAAVASTAPDSAASSAPVARTVARASTTVNREPIDGSVRYRVQRGDSLSVIAQRIENRRIGLWSAVAQIFDANPEAFIGNDPNRLKAGSLLIIPSFRAEASFAQATAPPPTAAAPDEKPVVQEAVSTAYPGVSETAAVDDTAILEPAATPAMEGLKPGDIILDADNPYIEPADTTPVTTTAIADTELEAPVTSTAPNVPVANIITADEPARSSTNWLLWLIGGGIAVIGGLLVFGRRNRDRDRGVPAPAIAVAHPLRRSSDEDTEQLEAVAVVDYDLEDDSPTHENLVLDADLEIGTGLEKGIDMDVAQDFGFAVTTHLDLELPAEPANTDDEPQTDIIAPPGIDESSILKSEMLPDDDDYDMSVIVDATKMPRPDDVTKRDLKAVQVGTGDETLISGDYTISKEVDYDILQQDYEDELTATQALNIEIEKAAAEIADRMEKEENAADMTSELPLATVTEIDVTANLRARNHDQEDKIGDNDDTGVNLELTAEMIAEEKTVEMRAEEKTVEMRAEEKTVEMPAPKGDSKTG